MKKYWSQLNIFSVVFIFLVLLVGFGILPRPFSLLVAAGVLGYLIFADFDQAVLFFVRMVPFFVALPLTSNFDSLNLWRPGVLVLFLRWFFAEGRAKRFWGILKKNTVTNLRFVLKRYPFECSIVGVFIFAFLSLFVAVDAKMGVEKMILFLNLAGFYPVIYSYVRDKGYKNLARSFTLALTVVVLVGFIQLGTAYMMDIDSFFEFWAGTVQKNFYGRQWSETAFQGNTWFVYPQGGAPRLRMFSTFPDSHSFPLYLLAGLPFVLVLFFGSFLRGNSRIWAFFSSQIKEKKYIPFLISFLAMLAVVLTGTRGMWVSFIFAPIVLAAIWFFQKEGRRIYKAAAGSLLIFLIVLPLAAMIFSTPQFKVQDSDSEKSRVFLERVRSVTNPAEISNKGRILIWKESFQSILRNAWLGVGVGNFPVILSEPVSYVKAGSTAHNLYLHIASVMGVPALLIFLGAWLVFFWQSLVFIFKKSTRKKDRFFVLTSDLFLVWILVYSLSDVALYDSRAFLGFIVLVGSVKALIDSSYE